VPTKRLKGKSYRDAVDEDEASKTKNEASPTHSKETPPTKSKQPDPSGLVMEVVIPVHKSTSTSAPSTSSPPPTTVAASSSAAEDTGNSDDDSDAPRVRKRRTAVKKAIIISDDEDEDDSDKAQPVVSRKKPPPAKNGRKGKASASSSSDYEAESAGDSTSDSASDSDSASASAETSSSEDDEPKRNSKAKSKKAPAKSKKAPQKSSKKQSAVSTDRSDDSMDVDEPATSKTTAKATAKKRKADEDGKQPAKKQKRREETDPWKLESSRVKREWTQMQAPPLEMFHFSRIVVDEYTYLDGKTHSMVTRQTGDRRWVLSGTVSQIRLTHRLNHSLELFMQPPIHDFGALKTISAYLDIHLGIDDEAEGRSAQVRKRTREQTGELSNPKSLAVNLLSHSAVEKFHSFREVHGLEWHANRHKVGQAFLDLFVRQVS
jgi:hypothetical protein